MSTLRDGVISSRVHQVRAGFEVGIMRVSCAYIILFGSGLARWLTTIRFAHPAQQIVLQDYIHAAQDAEARLDRLTRQIEELLPSWSMAPVVTALQAMRAARDANLAVARELHLIASPGASE
jgi:hypothetical protein